MNAYWVQLLEAVWNVATDPDLLQHASLFLELLGVFLFVLEYAMPNEAGLLEDLIDRASHKFSFPSVLERCADHYRFFQKYLGWPLFITVLIVGAMACAGSYYTPRLFPESWQDHWFVRALLRVYRISFLISAWFYSIALIGCVSPLLVAVLRLVFLPITAATSTVIGWFNGDDGRALGGFGIFLTSIGLCLEVVQVYSIKRSITGDSLYWECIMALFAVLLVLGVYLRRRHRRLWPFGRMVPADGGPAEPGVDR